MSSPVGAICLGCAFAIVAASIWVNVGALWEAYGAGPPHYGRTVNMDKWVSPLPWLILLDAITAVVAFLIVRYARSRST